MLIAKYFTNDKFVHIKNKKGQTILKRRYKKRGNYFTIPYQPIRTKNKIRLVRKLKPNFKLLNILFKYMPPERYYDIDKINLNKSYDESTKACIYPALGNVFIHPDFLDKLNEVEKKQVLFHEVGHLFYQTEAKADLFSATILYILGYSPYQIMKASKDTLQTNPMNVKRWNILLKYLENARR